MHSADDELISGASFFAELSIVLCKQQIDFRSTLGSG